MKRLKMTILFLGTILASFTSNGQESSVTLEFDNAASANQIAQDYVKALQQGNVAEMSAKLANDAMVYGLGGGLDSLDVAQHTEYYKNSTANYKHNITQDLYLPVKVENNWNEGEWVLTWGTNTITNKKTGKSTVVPYHTACLVKNGKITSMRYFYDMLNLLKSQGYQIAPPGK